MRTLRTRLLTALALMSALPSSGQVAITSKSGDFTLQLIGRTAVDLGTYLGTEGAANRNGMSVNDTRLGLVANFDSLSWQAKIEICYQSKAISFRDVYIQRNFAQGAKKLAFGNFFIPFGLKPAGLAYKFIETGATDQAFTPARKLGLAYTVMCPKFNWMLGFFSEGSVDAKPLNAGYAFAGHFLYRPLDRNGSIFHVSVTPIFSHPRGGQTLAAGCPETFSGPKLATTAGMDVWNIGRLDAMALYIIRRFYIEAHYMGAWANRVGKWVEARDADGNVIVDAATGEASKVRLHYDTYKSNGFFAQTSFRILGEAQNYNRKTGLAGNPTGKKVLEVLARYSLVNLSDEFGKVGEFTVGLNYFWNKYVRVKLNYAWAKELNNGEDGYGALEGRVQFSF